MKVKLDKSVQDAADSLNVDVSLPHSASPITSRVNRFDATSDEDLDDSGSDPETRVSRHSHADDFNSESDPEQNPENHYSEMRANIFDVLSKQ